MPPTNLLAAVLFAAFATGIFHCDNYGATRGIATTPTCTSIMGCCCGSASSIDESSVIARVKTVRYTSLGIGRMDSYGPGILHTDGNVLEYDIPSMKDQDCSWCCGWWGQSFPVANIKFIQVQSNVLTIKVEKNGIPFDINAVVDDSDDNMDHFFETVTRLSGLAEKSVSNDETPPPYTPTNTTSQHVSRLHVYK